MISRELSLFADLDQGRLVQGFSSTLQATLPRFVFGDAIPVAFRALKSNANNSGLPWSEVDLTGRTVRIAIGNPAGAATGGTFTLTYGANTTSALAFNADGAAIQTALNALASITAAGGVVVTRASTGAFRIVFNTVGVRTGIVADTSSIYPSSGAEVHVAVPGTASVRQIVVARVESLPAAYAELTDEFPVAAATVVNVRTGSVSVGAIISLAFPVLPYGGTYQITIGGQQTASIPWAADAAALKTALELLSSVTSGKATITGTFPEFTINFALSLGNVGAMTVATTALVVPKGRTGTINTNTAGMLELLNGAAQSNAKLEIEFFDENDATTWTVLQVDCTVIDDVIGNTPSSVAGGPAYVTTAMVGPTITRTSAQGAPTHPTVPILAIGQQCRVGDSAPYIWHRAETLTSWGFGVYEGGDFFTSSFFDTGGDFSTDGDFATNGDFFTSSFFSTSGNFSTSGDFSTSGTSPVTLAMPNGGPPKTYTFPITTATLARTDAAQTFAGAQTFSGNLLLTESQQTLADSAITRKLADLHAFPFLRSTETSIIRRKLDSFLTGNATSGSIGEWGWALATNGTQGYVGGREGFSIGRAINIPTGATIGNKSEMTRGVFATNAHTGSAVSFHIGSAAPNYETCIVNNAKFWAGWIDSSTLASAAGQLLVGWDTSTSANFLIRRGSSSGGGLTTIDTGVAVPRSVTWNYSCFTFTVIGGALNNYLTGVYLPRVIVSGRGNNSNYFAKMLDVNVSPNDNIYNAQLLIYGEAVNAYSKDVVVSGVEVFMPGPNELGVG